MRDPINYSNPSAADLSPGNFHIRELVGRYAKRWPLFLITLALSFSIAFAYLYFNVPFYEAQSTVLIKDDRISSGISETALFEDLGILMNRGNLDNEIELFKSRSLMKGVVEKFNLHISVYEKKQPINADLYPGHPFDVSIQYTKPNKEVADTQLVIKVVSATHFAFNDGSSSKSGNHAFGSPILTSFGKVSFNARPDKVQRYIGKEILIHFRPVDVVVGQFLSRLKVDAVNNKANVIKLSLRDPVPQKAIDIVDALVQEHKQNEINDNNQVALNTAAFIQERIVFINEELSDVENTVQDYKTGNQLVDLPIESDLFLSTATETEKELSNAFIQLKLSEFLLDYLKNNSKPDALIPSNLGLNDQTVNLQIEEYNRLVMNRSRLQLSSGIENPLIVNLNAQINSLRVNIKEALQNQLRSLNLKYDEVLKRSGNIQSKISSVPRKEREFRELERQRQIKESLYLYLLQKREETSIALAVPLSNTKIIDSAYSSKSIVSPNRKLILALALMLGFALPIGGIYVLSLFDTKLHDRQDVDTLNVPFAGEIPYTDERDSLIFPNSSDRAAMESFRSLRTNLSFLIDPHKTGAKTIAITSSVAQEGKTFISINLAAAIALSGKKVLVWGLDLRTPKLLQYLGLPDSKGFTNYLTGEKTEISELLLPIKSIDGLYALASGDIPPNPSELLLKDRANEVFDYFQSQFDYIVIDTAPVGLVADALLLGDHVDTFLYVVRAGSTDKRLLSIPAGLYKENRLKNMAIIMNEAPLRSDYGYVYEYYGKRSKKSWWKRS